VKLFSGRTKDLEIRNRILADSARQRGQRIEELELALQRQGLDKSELSQKVQELELGLIAANKRTNEFEEHNRQLTETATRRALRVQELEQELLTARIEFAGKDFDRVEAERAFYSQRANELEEHNRQLTEATRQYALRAQELEQELLAARAEFAAKFAAKDFDRLEGENAYYCKRLKELEDHNRQLTEAATQRAARAQELEEELTAIRRRQRSPQGQKTVVESMNE
jgi:chromosome segregation ATPase